MSIYSSSSSITTKAKDQLNTIVLYYLIYLHYLP